MKTLYEIGSEMLAVFEVMEQCEGDLARAGEETEALLAYLDQAEAEKLQGYANLRSELQARAVGARAQLEQWQAKVRSLERHVARLDEALLLHAERTGQTRMPTADGREIAVVNNGGEQPVVIDVGVDPSWHQDFARASWSWDRNLIRDALTIGRELPFARLGERGRHVRIR